MSVPAYSSHPAPSPAPDGGQTDLWIRHGRWLPLLIALLVGVAFQGTRGLTETSETRYAECAREMLVTGNWLEPQLQFQPHWTKPPAAYWFIAAGMKTFGINAWGARLPGVAALLVATWAVGAIGRRLWDERTGAVAATAFALGFPVFGAFVVTTDIYLTAAETLAALAFVCAVREEAKARRLGFVCAMWAMWGVAFLIKGPPALLPLLAIIPWNFLRPRDRRVPLGDWRGLLCFAATALPWYLVMLHRHPNLLDYYVGTEIVGRVSTNLGHNRAWYKAIEIYGPVLVGAVGAFGPWAAVLAWRSGWGRAAKWRDLWRSRDPRLLLVGWVVLPMIVFCASRSKLHLYALPLAAPLALLTGRVLAQRASRRAWEVVVIVSLVAFVAVKAASSYTPARRDMARLSESIRAELARLPAGAQLVLWDMPTNHGLTFYLGRNHTNLPERVAVGERGKFETWTIEDFAKRVGIGVYNDGALLVIENEREAMDALARAVPGLPVVAETKGRYWNLIRLGRSPEARVAP